MSTTSYDDRRRTRARAVVVGVVLVLRHGRHGHGRVGVLVRRAAPGPEPPARQPPSPSRSARRRRRPSSTPVAWRASRSPSTNPNTVSLHLTIPRASTPRRATAASTSTPGTRPATLSTFSFTAQNNGGAGWNTPASGSLSVTLPASLAMGAGADNACQGAQRQGLSPGHVVTQLPRGLRRALVVLPIVPDTRQRRRPGATGRTGSVPGGNGLAAATSVDQGSTPTAVASGRSVTVSWAATTMANGAFGDRLLS